MRRLWFFFLMFRCTFGPFCSKFSRAAKERAMFNTLQRKQSPSTAILGIVSSAACAAFSSDWDSLWRRGSTSSTWKNAKQCKIRSVYCEIMKPYEIHMKSMPSGTILYKRENPRLRWQNIWSQVMVCNVCQVGPWSSSAASLWSFFTCALFAWSSRFPFFWVQLNQTCPNFMPPKKATNMLLIQNRVIEIGFDHTVSIFSLKFWIISWRNLTQDSQHLRTDGLILICCNDICLYRSLKGCQLFLHLSE